MIKNELPKSVLEFNKYLLDIKGKSQTTIDGYNGDLKLMFKFLLHKKKNTKDIDSLDISDIEVDFIKEITLNDLYDFISYMRDKKKNSKETTNRKVATIKSFFKFLKKNKIIENNVAEDLERSKVARRKPICLDNNQIKQVFKVLNKKDKFYYRDKCILSILFNTGVRVGELTNIKLSDIKDNILTVIGKGDKQRDIFLNKTCLKDIQDYLKVRENLDIDESAKEFLLINEHGRHLGKRMIQNIVKKCYELAGLDDKKYVTHSARHSVGTNIYNKTESILAVAEVLGHASLNTARIYITIDEDKMKNIMEKMY